MTTAIITTCDLKLVVAKRDIKFKFRFVDAIENLPDEKTENLPALSADRQAAGMEKLRRKKPDRLSLTCIVRLSVVLDPNEPHSNIGHIRREHIDFYVKNYVFYVPMW